MKKCMGKNSYESERAAKRVRNIREHRSQELRVYACPYCYKWHLTSLKKWEKPTHGERDD